jgi:hypothetical protein
MRVYKTIAIVDDVHTCDCCGKSDLKTTVAMESEAGEIVHFGSTCATPHGGRDTRTVKRETDDGARAKMDAAIRELKASAEYKAYDAKLDEARRLRFPPGPGFADYVRAASNAAAQACACLTAKHGLPRLSY